MKHVNNIVAAGIVKDYVKAEATSVLMIWMFFEAAGEMRYVPLSVRVDEKLFEAVDQKIRLECTVKVTGALQRDEDSRIYIKAESVEFDEGRIS